MICIHHHNLPRMLRFVDIATPLDVLVPPMNPLMVTQFEINALLFIIGLGESSIVVVVVFFIRGNH